MHAFMGPSEARQKTSGDEGAVAIIVAILLVLLIGIAAFTIDFGEAYNSKRQLQLSADAASLAAANELAQRGVRCPNWTADDEDAARAVAMSVMGVNHGTASYITPVVPADDFMTCANAAFPDQMVVTWRNEATTEVGLGQVFGLSDLTTNRVARAVVNEAAVGGLRPLALCSTSLDGPTPRTLRVNMDGHNADGGCDGASGNWRQVDCPGSDNNGNPAYIVAIDNGCADPVVPVAGQPAPGDPALRDWLLDACPAGNGDSDEDCLAGNTGQVFGGQIPAAWERRLDETIRFPVICGPTNCDPPAFQGVGNNAQFPIHQIAEAVVCGVHPKNGTAVYGVSADCFGADTFAGDGHDNWLVLRLLRVLDHNDPDVVSTGPGSINLVN